MSEVSHAWCWKLILVMELLVIHHTWRTTSCDSEMFSSNVYTVYDICPDDMSRFVDCKLGSEINYFNFSHFSVWS